MTSLLSFFDKYYKLSEIAWLVTKYIVFQKDFTTLLLHISMYRNHLHNRKRGAILLQITFEFSLRNATANVTGNATSDELHYDICNV